MENLIDKSQLITIEDNDTTDDTFDKNDVILIKLNYLLNEYQQDNIIDACNWWNNCDYNTKNDNGFDTIEYVIRNGNDVFNSIYTTGKQLFKLIKSKQKDKSLNYLIDNGFIEPNISKSFKKTFNQYIQKYGYPYLLEDNVPYPQYEEFIVECIMVYLIDEVRKWNFKTKQDIKEGYNSLVDPKFITLYNMIKPELIAITMEVKDRQILDNFDKSEIIQALEYGPMDKGTEEPVDNYNEKFFTILQRSLMLYITNHINGRYKEQYQLTKQKPIYNEDSEQHRVYIIANSLMGIAYDKLLLNLTATEFSCERIICNVPHCINEFEQEKKYKRCILHRPGGEKEDEAKHYDNQRNYKTNKN